MINDNKSWYVRYRPFSFDDYRGEQVKKTVMRRFTDEKKRPQVVLIHGPRGCGKTTFCRIMPKFYLCEHPKPDGTPCEECEMCREINEKLVYAEEGVDAYGVREINAASTNSKEAVDSIMEEALTPPPPGLKKKILIFDECHRMSVAAQDALLKTIEDIPEHLVVFFATTEYDKVRATIKSRVAVTLEVRRQTVDEMAERLMEIAEMEKLTVSMEALKTISRLMDRIPRECITTLENVAKSFDGVVNVDNVLEITGNIDSEIYLEYYLNANKSLEDILLFNKKLKEKDIEIDKFLSGLMKFTLNAMYVKHGIGLEDFTTDFIKKVRALFEMYKSSDFDMLLEILEYASIHITKDDAKDEVLLTTTAMRIGKIDLLANGLTSEMERAVEENNISLEEHRKRINSVKANIQEEFKVDFEAEEVKKEFQDVEVVTGSNDLMVQLESFRPEGTVQEDHKVTEEPKEEKKEKDIVDSFFDED